MNWFKNVLFVLNLISIGKISNVASRFGSPVTRRDYVCNALTKLATKEVLMNVTDLSNWQKLYTTISTTSLSDYSNFSEESLKISSAYIYTILAKLPYKIAESGGKYLMNDSLLSSTISEIIKQPYDDKFTGVVADQTIELLATILADDINFGIFLSIGMKNYYKKTFGKMDEDKDNAYYDYAQMLTRYVLIYFFTQYIKGNLDVGKKIDDLYKKPTTKDEFFNQSCSFLVGNSHKEEKDIKEILGMIYEKRQNPKIVENTWVNYLEKKGLWGKDKAGFLSDEKLLNQIKKIEDVTVRKQIFQIIKKFEQVLNVDQAVLEEYKKGKGCEEFVEKGTKMLLDKYDKYDKDNISEDISYITSILERIHKKGMVPTETKTWTDWTKDKISKFEMLNIVHSAMSYAFKKGVFSGVLQTDLLNDENLRKDVDSIKNTSLRSDMFSIVEKFEVERGKSDAKSQPKVDVNATLQISPTSHAQKYNQQNPNNPPLIKK